MRAAAVLLLAITTMTLGSAAASVVTPAAGKYVASGSAAHTGYHVSAVVRRGAGHANLSVRVRDRCGGFTSFPRVRVLRSRSGVPIFSAQVGGAKVSGHWVGRARIDGTVKTPCTRARPYVLRLAP